jgi:hypothetical protein
MTTLASDILDDSDFDTRFWFRQITIKPFKKLSKIPGLRLGISLLRLTVLVVFRFMVCCAMFRLYFCVHSPYTIPY